MIIGKHLQYPIESWRNYETGSVDVSVTVSKDGVVTQAKALDDPPISQALREAALADATSWRFEPGATVEEFRVKYRFEFTGNPERTTNSFVRYHLPTEVVVTATPSL